jgi:hypothetical protein
MLPLSDKKFASISKEHWKHRYLNVGANENQYMDNDVLLDDGYKSVIHNEVMVMAVVPVIVHTLMMNHILFIHSFLFYPADQNTLI